LHFLLQALLPRNPVDDRDDRLHEADTIGQQPDRRAYLDTLRAS
jgi:hypothetical protein